MAACGGGALFSVAVDWGSSALSGRKYTFRDGLASAGTGCAFGLGGFGVGHLVKRGWQAYQISRTTKVLTGLGNQAARTLPGRGSVRGTLVHSEFKRLIEAQGLRNVYPEVTYFRGVVERYGYPGAVRLDAVLYSRGRPIAVWDLKTGGATLTRTRVVQIRTHLPNGGIGVRIQEISVP